MTKDLKDVIFVVFLVVLYSFTFLTYAAVGNVIIAGQKISKISDFLHPFSKGYPSYYRSNRNQPDYFFPIYYLVFFVLVIASSFKIMSVRSTFRAWIDRLLGYSEEQQPSAISASSGSTIDPQASGSRSPVTSNTSLSKKSSKAKMKSSRSKTPPERKKRKDKVPNVMRASVVDPEHQIIPPLPRLSIREDTAEKLSRVLNKFDSMDLGSDTESRTKLTPTMKRKND